MNLNAGYIVETKTGLKGYTKHSDNTINGKVVVYVTDENGAVKKLLCIKESLKIIGYSD